MRDMDRLLARKRALTPGIAMAAPRAPFRWHRVPYVHAMLEPNSRYAEGVLTTDALGLRRVWWQSRLIGFAEFQQLPGPKKLLIGASTAYSMGCSADRTSIASRLCDATGVPWFHLAMGSHVSTQELILYCLTNPKEIDEIVILSGLNTLSACLLNESAGARDDVFPPNFHFSPATDAGLLQQLLGRIHQRLADGWGGGQAPMPSIAQAQPRMQAALTVMENTLEVFNDICRSRQVALTFLAQPLLSAMRKPLAPQEEELADIQRRLSAHRAFRLWGLYGRVLPAVYPAYCRSLGEICRRLGMRFADLNEAPRLNTPQWLFSDQAHFTDEGCAACMDIITALSRVGAACGA